MSIEYNTERLILKQLDGKSAKLVLDYYVRNKEFLSEWEAVREDDFYTLNTQKSILDKDLETFKNGSSLKYWIFSKSDKTKVIGCVSFQNIVRSIMQSFILGYKLDSEEVGKGYISEALEKAIQIFF